MVRIQPNARSKWRKVHHVRKFCHVDPTLENNGIFVPNQDEIRKKLLHPWKIYNRQHDCETSRIKEEEIKNNIRHYSLSRKETRLFNVSGNSSIWKNIFHFPARLLKACCFNLNLACQSNIVFQYFYKIWLKITTRFSYQSPSHFSKPIERSFAGKFDNSGKRKIISPIKSPAGQNNAANIIFPRLENKKDSGLNKITEDHLKALSENFSARMHQGYIDNDKKFKKINKRISEKTIKKMNVNESLIDNNINLQAKSKVGSSLFSSLRSSGEKNNLLRKRSTKTTMTSKTKGKSSNDSLASSYISENDSLYKRVKPCDHILCRLYLGSQSSTGCSSRGSCQAAKNLDYAHCNNPILSERTEEDLESEPQIARPSKNSEFYLGSEATWPINEEVEFSPKLVLQSLDLTDISNFSDRSSREKLNHAAKVLDQFLAQKFERITSDSHQQHSHEIKPDKISFESHQEKLKISKGYSIRYDQIVKDSHKAEP